MDAARRVRCIAGVFRVPNGNCAIYARSSAYSYFFNILAAYESSSPPHRTRPPTQSAPHNQQCVCLRQHTHTPSAADATSRCATSKVATWPTHRYPPHTHSRAITEHRPCETVDLARSTTSCAGGNTPKSRKLKAVRLIQIMSVMAGALLIMPGSSTACALQPLR